MWFNNQMRLSPAQVEVIRQVTREVVGPSARVVLFGSRTDDALRGGDVDLMIELEDEVVEPALVMARIASRISRRMDGRKVDVLLKAPNLSIQPIHAVAEQTGIVLCG